MDGFHLCKLTRFTFSFGSFRNSCDSKQQLSSAFSQSDSNRAYCFLISGNLVDSGASLAWGTSSGNAEVSVFHKHFQDHRVAGAPHLGPWCDQCSPLTPHITMSRGDPLLEQRALHRQSQSSASVPATSAAAQPPSDTTGTSFPAGV